MNSWMAALMVEIVIFPFAVHDEEEEAGFVSASWDSVPLVVDADGFNRNRFPLPFLLGVSSKGFPSPSSADAAAISASAISTALRQMSNVRLASPLTAATFREAN